MYNHYPSKKADKATSPRRRRGEVAVDFQGEILLNIQRSDNMASENDIIKYEIAEELGLLDKVNATGWKSLTAKESGRVGGILARRKRDAKKGS